MKNLLSLFFIFIIIPCSGQNVDSLKKVIAGNGSAQSRLKATVELSNYFSSKEADETLKTAAAGLKLAGKQNDKTAMGLLLMDMGKAYYQKHNYDSTARLLNQSAAIFEKLNDQRDLAANNHSLAILYIQLKDYKKAIAYYGKVINYSQKIGSHRLTMNLLEQLGKLYEDAVDYKEALRCYKQSLDIRDSLNIAQKIKDSISVSYSLDFVGDVFGSMKQKGDSEAALLKTIETKKSLNDTLALAINYMNLGMLYKKKNEFPKSLDALQLCLQYAAKIKYTDLQNNALNELSDLYEQTGDYRQALVYFKKHQVLNSAVYAENSSKNISELQNKYETTQKENRILQQQFEISKRNYWVGGIFIVLLLSLLLSYSYYKRSQLKQQNIATNAIIETEEKERKRIAQDLHDSVSQLMMAAKINLSVVGNEIAFADEAQKSRYEKAINLVDEGFKEVRTISHNMMPQALLESGLSLVIKQFIENIGNDAITINFFSKGFEDHFDNTIETILYRILQECINNVMKHAKASRVDISLIRDEDNISLTIEDNGKGFDTTDAAHYDGMGLKNMRTRVNFLKGKIELDSHPGRGTLVSVYIPLKR